MKVFARNNPSKSKTKVVKTKNTTVTYRERGKTNVGAANAIRNGFANLFLRAGRRLSGSGNALRK